MRHPLQVALTVVALVSAPFAIAVGCGDNTQGGGSAGSGATSSSSGAGGSGASGSTGSAGGGGMGGGSAGGGGIGGGSAGGGGMGGGSAGGGGIGGGSAGGGGIGGVGGASSSSASSSSASSGAGGVGGGFVEVKCLNQVYACGDTLDNDGDGLVDWMDPDCLGPCDNTEDSYYGGIPGQAGPNCDVDCYWDSNSGSGNDDCFWNHKCDPNEMTAPGHPEPMAKCPYDPNTNISGTGMTCAELGQTQSATCLGVCLNITPNGCDCFGCCELPSGSGKWIWLGSEDEATGLGACTVANIDDPTKCEPCTPVPSCTNSCGHCELCIGKDQLPPDCLPQPSDAGVDADPGDGGVSEQCPAGIQPCGLPGQDPCASGYYCITGCCKSLTGG